MSTLEYLKVKLRSVKKVQTGILFVILVSEYYYRQHLWDNSRRGVDNFQLQYTFMVAFALAGLSLFLRGKQGRFISFIIMSVAIFYGSANSASILLYQSLIPFIIVFELDIDEYLKIIFAYYITIFYHQRASN